jgi:hypothetical protein
MLCACAALYAVCDPQPGRDPHIQAATARHKSNLPAWGLEKRRRCPPDAHSDGLTFPSLVKADGKPEFYADFADELKRRIRDEVTS